VTKAIGVALAAMVVASALFLAADSRRAERLLDVADIPAGAVVDTSLCMRLRSADDPPDLSVWTGDQFRGIPGDQAAPSPRFEVVAIGTLRGGVRRIPLWRRLAPWYVPREIRSGRP
jgi:hypothetical protein